ncbi:FecR family protein [Foetidibacter luteolus]|uniref:FecR family protein n=1 Tax=Foetidibacter luteolus TaxID=2608880 RepID=UPI00129ABB1E|nr:FecR family protein [Foetidibacter luteolus]
MENSNQYDELLLRYLAGDLNTEEKAGVEDWLAAEPNREHFEELKAIWKLAMLSRSSRIDINTEWLHFKQTIDALAAETLSKNNDTDEDYIIQPLPIKQHRGLLYRLSVAAAVAASVILVAGISWKFFYKSGKDVRVTQQSTEDSSQQLVLHHHMNTSDKDSTIIMSDGSWIVLTNGSEITYGEPFSKKRDVELTGKAFFKVAKGKPVAFIVTSRDIATTAIGTEFQVSAFAKSQQLSVRLHEGKVVVKAVNKANTKMKEDVYLLPGQELVYDYKMGVTVRDFTEKSGKQNAKIVNAPVTDSLNIPNVANSSWYMFNNQSLEQVLISLSALYNAKIVYNKKDIKKIYFTGKYDKTDSLEKILKRIAAVNELNVTKKDSAFIITK